MEHQQWETQFVYLKDKSRAINLSNNNSIINKSSNKPVSKEKKLDKQIEEGKLKHTVISNELKISIQKARSTKNLTQKQLANLCNLPVSVINDIETGKAKYNHVQINKIKRVLNIKF